MSWLHRCDISEHVRAASRSQTTEEMLHAAKKIKQQVELLPVAGPLKTVLLDRLIDAAKHHDKVYFDDVVGDITDWFADRRVWCPVITRMFQP